MFGPSRGRGWVRSMPAPQQLAARVRPDVEKRRRGGSPSSQGIGSSDTLGLSKDDVLGYECFQAIDAQHSAASPPAVVFLGMLQEKFFARALSWGEAR
jgi:hypothetical protein